LAGPPFTPLRGGVGLEIAAQPRAGRLEANIRPGPDYYGLTIPLRIAYLTSEVWS